MSYEISNELHILFYHVKDDKRDFYPKTLFGAIANYVGILISPSY